jgi:thioredoxin 1
MKIPELNYTNFDQYLQGKTVIVDFWAEWCHPCHVQHKILNQIALENDHQLSFARLNVDDNKVLSLKLGVRNLPTLIIFDDGKEIRRIIGLQNREILEKQILNTVKIINKQIN